MGVEVVHNQHDPLGIWVTLLHQLLDLLRPVSTFVRCSVISTQRLPAKGSMNMNTLATPPRSYS